MLEAPEEFSRLALAIEERDGGAYVMTVTADGRPHATYCHVQWQAGHFVAEVGKQTARNASERPLVSVLFPVRSPEDYSLIVDGTASADAASQSLSVTPTRAVLHRPGIPTTPGSACGSDCIALYTATA
jgi:hypothetical protein